MTARTKAKAQPEAPQLSLVDDGPVDAPARLILAHGAGAPSSSPFMTEIARLLVEQGLAVTRFDFNYMSARVREGKRKPPPRAEKLIAEYEAAVAEVRRTSLARGQRLLIGGKSMGGRVASMAADALHDSGQIDGLVVLGYPFHPPAKPEQLRTAHLESLATPALVVQGDRDPFGTRAEVEALRLAPSIRFHWATDGDHDLGPRGGSGATRKGNMAAAAAAVAAFAASL